MYSKMAVLAFALVGHAARWTSSIFSVAKKLSATALSQQLPLRLMLQTMPRAPSGCW